MEQPLSLFPEDSPFDFAMAAKLPPRILFGTSSWTYPGWQGLVYKREYKNENDLKKRSLEEYGQFPWFRTVGVDSSFYSPLSEQLIKRYDSQLPEHFRWAQKVWEEITIPRYAAHPRYGAKAGRDNPFFLDAPLFQEKVLYPYQALGRERRCGPFMFEFQSFGRLSAEDGTQFLKKLDHFLKQLPETFLYSVEIRSPALLTPEYFRILNDHRVGHVFNHWTGMPPLKDQMKAAAAAGGLAAPFFVSRILTPLGVTYEQAVKQFQPYDRIKKENPEMRADVVRLALRALERNIDVYILVNNRSEGCAPLTIQAIGEALIERLKAS